MRVVAVLTQLGGIAPARDLAAHGIGAGLVRAAWQRGEITRFRKGWYAIPTLSPDVIRASRVGGVLSCMSAARAHDLWTPDDAELHVAVPPTAARLRRPEDHHLRLSETPGRVVVHWSASAEAPYLRVEPIDTTIRRIVDCRGPRAAYIVAESALNRGRLLPDVADRLITDLVAEDAVFRSLGYLSDSGIESMLKLALIAAGIPFRQQVGIEGCGIADFLIGRHLVVETDGRAFHDPLADRRRDARFSIAGYRTLRFLARQVLDELDAVMASITAAIARGDHR